MKPTQFPIEERVESIEKVLVFGLAAAVTFNEITQNKTSFFGINMFVFDLIVFFISFPLSFYNLITLTFIVGGRYGESVSSFLQKYKSKLFIPFFLSFVLISGLIMYLLGKELKDIISSILLIFIGVVINKVFIDPYVKKIEKQKKKLGSYKKK